jgi:hypothetical protein
MLSKMKQGTKLGSRIAEVHNGSSLFTGDAGQGESNIRRWIIENDWLDAIVALPVNMFYNTGIATYIWVLTNRKRANRKGRVQLIDATQWFRPLRKNLGKKNCELSGDRAIAALREATRSTVRRAPELSTLMAQSKLPGPGLAAMCRASGAQRTPSLRLRPVIRGPTHHALERLRARIVELQTRSVAAGDQTLQEVAERIGDVPVGEDPVRIKADDLSFALPAEPDDLVQHVRADDVTARPPCAFEHVHAGANTLRHVTPYRTFDGIGRQIVNESGQMNERAEVVVMKIQKLLRGQDWWHSHIVRE